MGTDDKFRNKMEEAKGKAKEAAGRFTGDRETRKEGEREQTSSHLRQAAEKVKDAGEKIKEAFHHRH